MLRIAVLLTAYNRKQQVLSCLQECFRQIDGMKADDRYAFSVWLVDDGSTDGLAEAVRGRFPSVALVEGSGELYWNRGMRLAWETAAREDFDFYLWLRADVVMAEGALAALAENSEFLRHRAIIAGSVTSGGQLSASQSASSEGVKDAGSGSLSPRIVAGGRTKGGRLIAPDPVIPVPCHTFDGYVVWVPRTAFRALGNLDARYTHGFGDLDYGVRAGRQGITRVVAPGILGTYFGTALVPKWRDAAYPLRERLRYLKEPGGRPPREQFMYDIRNRGLFHAVGRFLTLVFLLLFPTRKTAIPEKR